MKATDINLVHLLNGTKQFLIPIFQRTYSWKEENCEQLFRDIVRVGESKVIDSHFIGSVVTIPDQEGQASLSRHQVIDGQQRLTTITLLILALLKKANDLNMETIDGSILEGIKEDFIINRHYKGVSRCRLVLTKGDFPALLKLIEGGTIPEHSSEKVWSNFQLFCDLLVKTELIEMVYKGLRKLKVVDVTLHPGQDDPQAIFESLNSTGVDLSQADLIRNFVLMRQPHETQTTLYNDFWFPMEPFFVDQEASRFDRFMQDFLTLQTGSNSLVKARDVYPLFKQWYLENIAENISPQVLMGQMLRGARHYSAFSLRTEPDTELSSAFRDLRSLVEVASPSIIRLYQCYEEELLSKRDFVGAVRLIESYILRRLTCDMQTRSLGNIFAMLAQKIEPENALESIKVALARFSKNSRFPNNSEFFQALIHKELYESRICHFVLSRLENFGSKEKVVTKGATIEHIMPRNENMRAGWRSMLGDQWKEIHEVWLHRLGNLTLTAYNSEYSDNEFSVKKTMENGFDSSPFRLNMELKKVESWTDEDMKTRGERLAQQALKVWESLEISEKVIAKYKLKDKELLGANLELEDVKGINDKNRPLAELLQAMLEQNFPNTSIVLSKKNITAFAPHEFLQVVPRARNITLIMAIEYDLLEPELQQLCRDTNSKSFISNASLSGVFQKITSFADLEKIEPLIERAYQEITS